ncbi:hypothetical protein [Qipengyuania nanhaisediminis]|uniref:hypothetical protein n=1 Tax=Qipengyuania nanhaisediminis TaxID=604088 RepID=UPI0038B357B0
MTRFTDPPASGMTGNSEPMSDQAIAMMRDYQRRLANQCFSKGITPNDIAQGSLFAAFDIAEGAVGPGLAAVEWMRTGLDVIESQLMSEGE